MNARVFLLLLITGLFMTAWTGDQTAKQKFLALRSQQRQILTAGSAGLPAPRCPDKENQPRTPIPTSLGIDRHVVSHFRPDGMGSGTYRAVSEHGVTFELTVDNSNAVAGRDFYVADSPGGTRWYFVRIPSSN